MVCFCVVYIYSIARRDHYDHIQYTLIDENWYERLDVIIKFFKFFQAWKRSINFSGGEPFIHKKGKFVGELVRYCKETLKLPSVSIVSNGSLITEEWFQEYGERYQYHDINYSHIMFNFNPQPFI